MPIVDPRIRKAWQNRNLVPLVGAGVSRAVSDLPDWNGLLKKGIEFLARRPGTTEQSLKALNVLHETGELVLGFTKLQQALGGAEGQDYEVFLQTCLGSPTVNDTGLIAAIRGLDSRIILTTNCDLILRDQAVIPDAELATWLDPKQMLEVLRTGSGIIHLHGRYDWPKSVILSGDDYARIKLSAPDKETVVRSMFHSGVLLFVGCSLDGVSDPHLSTLLAEFSRVAGPLLENSAAHFFLMNGTPSAEQHVVLRRLGIEPVSYGKEYTDLPKYLESIPAPGPVQVSTTDVRARLQALRSVTELDEFMDDIAVYLKTQVFPGRQIRVSFASLVVGGPRRVLRHRMLAPRSAAHSMFSYPQTVAAWALLEGRLLAWPHDKDRRCDFDRLRKLKKYDRVRDALLATDPKADPLLSRGLKSADVISKTAGEKLALSDLYQDAAGPKRASPYVQFVSVPVPVVPALVSGDSFREYGVINIDTKEEAALLTARTEPLLELISEYVAIAHELRSAAARPREESS